MLLLGCIPLSFDSATMITRFINSAAGKIHKLRTERLHELGSVANESVVFSARVHFLIVLSLATVIILHCKLFINLSFVLCKHMMC